jgi:predicted XRE-type DNA-binding protein
MSSPVMPIQAKARQQAENVFRAIGFAPVEAAKLAAKSALTDAISLTIKRRGLSQIQAAQRCKISSSALGNVLRGRLEKVTIDKLVSWLNALGHDVELRLRPHDLRVKEGEILVFPVTSGARPQFWPNRNCAPRSMTAKPAHCR